MGIRLHLPRLRGCRAGKLQCPDQSPGSANVDGAHVPEHRGAVGRRTERHLAPYAVRACARDARGVLGSHVPGGRRVAASRVDDAGSEGAEVGHARRTPTVARRRTVATATRVTGYWHRLQVIRTVGMLIQAREASRGYNPVSYTHLTLPTSDLV